MNNFELEIKEILNNLSLYLNPEDIDINHIDNIVLDLLKNNNNFSNIINFFDEKLRYSNKEKKYKILFIIEDILTFIIFFILLKYYLNHTKEENFYNLTFLIEYNKELILNCNNLILIFNNISSFQKILFNYFDELFFLDTKINIIKKDLFLSLFSNKDLNKLNDFLINNNIKSKINNEKNNEKDFFENIKKIIDIIKFKNLSAFSSAIQNEQYLRNFFKNLYIIKEKLNNNTRIYSINNINKKQINIFGASPKLNFFLNFDTNNLCKLNNYINFSIISNIDLFLKNNLFLDFFFNFDTNFFSIFNLQKLIKSISYFKNVKLNFLNSIFCHPYFFIKSFIYKKNLNLILINFNTILEKIVYNEIKLNNSYFSGTSINMLINFFDTISSEKEKNFEINIFGSDYENLDFKQNKISHHKSYSLYYYLLKKENYIKNLHSWETKNIFYSKEKHESYKFDLLNKRYNFLNLIFIKYIKQYEDFFNNSVKEKNKIEKFDLNIIDKEIFLKNINNLKSILNNFLNEIENYIINEKIENIFEKYYYKTSNQNKNLESDLFKELFFKEIYLYLKEEKKDFKNKLKKLKNYLKLI